MNITVTVDEVTLDAVVSEIVAYDEDGDLYRKGERTIADLVTEQITARLIKDDGYPRLAARVAEIRAEAIREAVRPQIDEAISKPFRKTSGYGEPVGEPITLRELIVEEARKAINAPVDKYNRERGTYLTQAVAAEVRKALSAEIADAVKTARALVAAQVGQQVAAAVEEGMRKR